MRLPDPAFWRERRVLITGHTGFKGSWLAFWLARLGARVTGLALPPATDPAAFRLLRIAAHVDSRFGDVRDDRALDDALRAAAPEIVFHLAAQPLVRAGYREPAATFDVNVVGTVRLLEAVRRSGGVRAVVVVTTDKCYAENGTGQPYAESDRLGGADPYSASKACAEIVTEAYRRSFFAGAGVAVATVRAGNVIGGGDWSPERLMTDLVAALSGGPPLTLRYPHAIRPWQHVLDPLAAYLILAERLTNDGEAFATAWNVGPDPSATATVAEMVERFERAWGEPIPRRHAEAAAPHEAGALLLDATAARHALSWTPRLDLDAAIAWTAHWYRAVHRGSDAARLSAEQLERYCALRPGLTAAAR